MQYPVPQFTDVEDKIIGSLTIRQFGIIFGAGVVIFLAFSATKSVPVLIFFALLVGIPALGIAFAKVNGRPMYKMFPYVYKFVISPKNFVFHKEARNFSGFEKVKSIEVQKEVVKPVTKETAQKRLSQINAILQEKEREERDLINQLK